MIVKILPKSSNFHAVDYNEKKVKQGYAELLEMSNFGYLQLASFDEINAASLKEYLIRYSAKNENIKFAQFHAAISCKGHSYTPEQLKDIAHQWLDKMGYGEKGQPLLIYLHHDTKNTHLHIVTSRVAPDGHKIDHNNERRRSQKYLNEIMGVDRKQETKDIMKNALKYSFATLGQFQAILESSGYECYTEDDNLNIKKDGVVLEHLPVIDIESRFKDLDKTATEKRRKQLKAILKKYRDLSANKEELRATIKKKLGVDLIFNGSKDKPYGYMIVDHSNKIVYKGSEVLPIKELLHFTGKKEITPEKITEFIKNKLEDDPNISTFEMSQELRKKFNAYISTGEEFTSRNQKKSGVINQGNKKYALEQDIYEKLRYNGRMKWLQNFHPQTEEEKAILVKFGHVEDTDKINVETNVNRDKIELTLAQINNIMNMPDVNIFEEFHKNKLILYKQDDKYYILDWNNKSIVDLQKEGIDTSMFKHASHHYIHNVDTAGMQKGANSIAQYQATGKKVGNAVKQIANPTGANRGTNRELEIDTHGDEYDDEHTLKR